MLAQFGTHTFRGRREFAVDLTRQVVRAGDEDAPLSQLSCTLYWAPRPATDALGAGDRRSFGLPSDVFFDGLPALPGWAWALSSAPPPAELAVDLDDV